MVAVDVLICGGAHEVLGSNSTGVIAVEGRPGTNNKSIGRV